MSAANPVMEKPTCAGRVPTVPWYPGALDVLCVQRAHRWAEDFPDGVHACMPLAGRLSGLVSEADGASDLGLGSLKIDRF